MKDFLLIARIVKPQGIRGEVKALTMTDSPEDLKAFDRVYIGGNCYKMLKVRPQSGNCAFITLSGIADRNAAEPLRGLDVEVAREDAPALPDDTYYIADMIGCKVVDEGGAEIGEVVEIIPAHTDVYELKTPDGKRLTFPAAEGLIKDVDIRAGKITVNGNRLAEVALED